MSFPANFYILSLLAAAATAAVSLPVWRRFCLRTDLVDDPGHRKIHSSPIALAGGLAVFTGIMLPILVGFIAVRMKVFPLTEMSAIEYGFRARQVQILGILAGAFGMLLIGLADDRWELRPAIKFGGQLLVALLVAAAGVRITLFVPSLLFSYLITVLWILTVVNAFNFMDNMNGLCGGLGAIAAFQFGILAAVGGQYLVALFAFLTAGALTGFLPYNFPRASAFLGDSGSHLVGYLLAVVAILPHFHTGQKSSIFAVFIPILVLAMPLADLVSVVLIRWRLGKPFYVGDQNHLSHRLVRQGWGQRQTVLWIWLWAAIAGAIGFLIQ